MVGFLGWHEVYQVGFAFYQSLDDQFALRSLLLRKRSEGHFQVMDSKHISGIPEIDAQHDELHKLADSLREVISKKDKRYLIHPALKRLHQLLATHFEYEEALMGMVNYPDLPQHTKMHKGVLKLLENYFDNPPTPDDHEHLGKLLTDKVLGHVTEHDSQMATSVKQYLNSK